LTELIDLKEDHLEDLDINKNSIKVNLKWTWGEHIDWIYPDEVSVPAANSYENDDNYLRPMKFGKYW